nr:DUF4296 domain-containing protein [Allomuricauda sp.]
MRKILALIITILVLSCAEKVIEPPEDLIPKENMIEILHDLALLKATSTSFQPALKNNNIDIMEFLFEKYGVDSVQFTTSDRYYASIPLEYQSIYEEVKARIAEQSKVLEDANKSRNDSIREAQKSRKDTIIRIKEDNQEPSK